MNLLGFLCLALLQPANPLPDARLVVKGRGVEGRPAYQGGGVVDFADWRVEDALIHFAGPEQMPLRLSVDYEVVEAAPVLLTSRFGTEYWVAQCYSADGMAALHTDEVIDLRQTGRANTVTTGARVDRGYGGPLAKGLWGLRGRRYFLIDTPDGQWLDVVDPPACFARMESFARQTFTVANLTRFELAMAEVRSSWEPGGPLLVKLIVTDADGDVYPVPRATATATAGAWSGELTPAVDELQAPSGWLRTTLPAEVPAEVTITAVVSALAPDGPREVKVERTFSRGEGRRDAAELLIVGPSAPELKRNAAGQVVETRALWVNPRSFATRAAIDKLVADAEQARLNVIIPDIFVRSTLMAKSDLWPLSDTAEEGLDPLGYLIERAHAAGIEVHPWFCVTYRDAAFRAKLGGVDIIDRRGQPESLGADVHRPKYRDFIVALMTGIARDYPVDGIHHDYIRTMSDCWCDDCRREFSERFGKPLEEATAEEWIAWHRLAVGDIVRRVAEGVRAVRPGAKLSAAVFAGLAGGARQGQDPAGWAREGWVDMVIPMDYDLDPLAVRRNERAFLEALDDDTKLVTGLSLYRRTGETAVPRSPELVASQITLVRKLGIGGYCLFEHTYLDDAIRTVLREGLNREPAAPGFR